MFDVSGGKERARKWPRSRKKRRTTEELEREEWFRQAQWATKYADPSQLAWAMEVTKNSPLLPRDILTMVYANRFAMIVQPGGEKLYPMPFKTDVSESLDAISQLEGQILQRGVNGWEGIDIPSASRIGVILERDASQTVDGTNTPTPVTWTDIIRDDELFFDPLEPAQITIPRSGWYDVSFYCETAGGGGSTRRTRIRQNGVDLCMIVQYDVSSSTNAQMTVSWCHYFSQGDIIQPMFTSSGSTGKFDTFKFTCAGG